MGWITNGANLPYYYWLWDEKAEKFIYAFCLCNAMADAASRQLVTNIRENAACYRLDYYRYSETGELRHIRRVVHNLEDNTLSELGPV